MDDTQREENTTIYPRKLDEKAYFSGFESYSLQNNWLPPFMVLGKPASLGTMMMYGNRFKQRTFNVEMRRDGTDSEST